MYENLSFREITDGAFYDEFIRQNGGSIIQTYRWTTIKTAWTTRMFMGFSGEEPIIAALCMERAIRPLGKLWYLTEGFITKTAEERVIKGMTAYLKTQMKKYGAFGICTDPMIVIDVDREAQPPSDLLAAMKKAGFVPEKDPRHYTVRPCVDIVVPVGGKSEEELLAACEKGVRHGYRTGIEGGIQIEVFDGDRLDEHPEALDTFFDVITETADRVEFVHRPKEYYATILRAVGKDGQIMLLSFDRDLSDARRKEQEEEIARLQGEIEAVLPQKGGKQAAAVLKKQIAALEKSLRTNQKAEDEIIAAGVSDRKIYLAAGITTYFGKESICQYGGTKNLLRNTLRPTHVLNVERLLESRRRGCEKHSMGRVAGDPYDETQSYYGLVAYKKSYGGRITTYPGDMYLKSGTGLKLYTFTTLFPKIRHFRSRFLRRRLNKQNTEGER